MKFAINTFLYTNNYTNEHVKNLTGKIKEIGFDGIEIALGKKGDLDYKKTLRTFKNNGLVCSSICGVFREDRDIRGPNKEYIKGGLSYIRDCLEACVELECDVLGGEVYSTPGRANMVPEEERKVQWDTVVENLSKVCQWAEKYGVFIAMEPLNRYETDFMNICKDAIKMVKDVGSKMLKIHLDTFHMNIEEKSSAIAILDAGDLLYLIHASENDRGAPGTGQIHWKSISDALRKINYNRWIVMECLSPGNKAMAEAAFIWRPTEKNDTVLAKKGLDFLKGLLS